MQYYFACLYKDTMFYYILSILASTVPLSQEMSWPIHAVAMRPSGTCR